MKNIIITVYIVFSVLALKAEPLCYFRHYSTEDGLPQYTIMDMLQDKKGFMWFGTWNGLSKFDGYTFRNYKVESSDSYYMKSNRIQRIYQDKYGRIWFSTYDGEIHCYHPDTQKFWGVQLIRDMQKNPFLAERIEIMPSGKVWLMSADKGCILVNDSLFHTTTFNVESGNLKGETVNAVFEDKQLNSWILTNNGVALSKNGNKNVATYFFEDESKSILNRQAFFCGVQAAENVYLGSQNGRIWRYNKKYENFNLIQTPSSKSVKRFVYVNKDLIFVIFQGDGLMAYQPSKNKFTCFNTQTLAGLKSDNIGETFLIDNQDLWFDTDEGGIYLFNIPTQRLTFFRVPIEDLATKVFPPRTMVFRDVKGRVWVQPQSGGFSLYNKSLNRLEPFFNLPNSPGWHFSNIIHSACSDRQGNLWLCTRSHGLEKIVFEQNHFKSLQINPGHNSVTANDVRCVFEDNQENLWVATKNFRLSVYNKKGVKLGYFSAKGKIEPNALMPAMVYSMIQDASGVIWIGTKGGGLFKIVPKGNQLKFLVENYQNHPEDVYSLSDNSIYSIFQDNHKNIWVGTYGGGINLVKTASDGKLIFINHRNNLKNFPIETASKVRFVTQNKQGNICVGSTAGMLMFSSVFSNPEKIEFKIYHRIPGDKNSLSYNDVHGICITKNGDMYIATFGGGLNKVTEFDKKGYPLKFKSFKINEGLPSDITLAVMEDEFGKLWISTENNLSKYDPEKNVFENFAEVKRLMVTDNFSEASTCRLKSNDLVFGYSNGIVNFSPRQIINSTYKPYIALSNLQIFNKKAEAGEENSPLTMSLNSTPKLILKHNQNFITLEFSALDYVDPENILYAYKLEGLDQDWNYVMKQRTANYTNLPKGKYIFRVKSTNSEGVWIENERALQIEILPSFWQTIWAYLLYLILLALIIALTVRILYAFYRLQANMELEKKMSEMKLRFFTDISHEIRTPLTMITAPVDFLMNDKKTPEDVKKHLKSISHNTNRMLRLVNQILDFRKIQFLHLKVQETEIASFVQDICYNFSEVSDNQHIKFNFSDKSKDDKVWVDQDCLEKIMMNLLSNAFKFTSPGKSINVVVTSDDKSVSVSVKDNGTGMSKEKQKNLFLRFASFNEDKSKPSTGIGLSMVKELVDKHNAKIIVESEEGKGSNFTVSFLRGVEHFDKNVEILAATSTDFEHPDTNLSPADENELNVIPEPDVKSNEKHSVLVVEDDNDLRAFIKSILDEEYLVYEAVDGKDGWEKGQKYCPDFIVSDIMMPEMDGIELLQKLKKDIHTSHIPVVLLTAKTTIESKLAGLSYGADDYITKPFSVPYFQARISNLIQQRKQLQELYRNNLQPLPNKTQNMRDYQPQPALITSQDELLMEKVMKVIEDNMENFDFTVEELGQNMMMSRSVFFKKIKGLTGLAPVEFIRDIKMKRAAQILSSGQYMVKEVAYLVGISDTKYFAKCFKNKFGITPLEYKNNKKQ